MLIEALFTAVMSTLPTTTLTSPVVPAADMLCDEHGKKDEKSESTEKNDDEKKKPKPEEPKPS